MKKKLILLLSLLSASAFANQTVGIGVYSKKTVYNAKNQISTIPIINLNYDNYYLKGSKIGYKLYKEPNFELSLMGELLGGHTDFAVKKSDLKVGYKDIKSRNIQQMIGLAVDFKFDRTTVGHISYVIGEKGSKGDFKLNKVFKINDRFSVIPGVSLSYYDAKYMNYYTGLDQEDVIKNKKINKPYKGKAIAGAGVGTTLEYALTEQVSTALFAGYEYYDNKIKKSDLVKDNKQIYAGIGFRYSF